MIEAAWELSGEILWWMGQYFERMTEGSEFKF